MSHHIRLCGCQAALKVVPWGGSEAASLMLEGRVYLRLRPLWDVVMPRLLACGPDVDKEGQLLATRLIPNSRHIDPKNDRHLLPQLRSALRAVHALGVVHGDLREANILVEEGQGGAESGEGSSSLSSCEEPPPPPRQRVWLIDFGLSELDATESHKDGELYDLSLLFDGHNAGGA